MFILNILTITLLQSWFQGIELQSYVTTQDIGMHRDKNCDCGKTFKPPDRILGGDWSNSTWKAHPWMVGLVNDGWIQCGGSLINTQYVLTAAHCLDEMESYPGIHNIRVAINVRHTSTRMLTLGIADYFIHPEYTKYKNGVYYANDIALIRLEKPIFYTRWIKPICLAVDPAMYMPGKDVTVTGFGYTEDGGNQSTVLQEITVPVVDREKCLKKLNISISEGSFCAGGIEKRDSCSGDSGGPMTYTDETTRRSYQLGIVSFGSGCGKKGIPGVYTRVDSYVHWIRSISVDAPSCYFPPVSGPNYDDCGIPEEACIQNTTSCKTGEFMYTWMARIFNKHKFLGTGVLVNRSFVLTSSSVISPWSHIQNEDIRVILGMRKVGRNISATTEIETGIKFIHHYPLQVQVPIVIIKLDQNGTELTALHRPLCMLDPNTTTHNLTSRQQLSLMFWQQKETRNSESMMVMNIETMENITKNSCDVGRKMAPRIMCGNVNGHTKCHENGAVLMDYIDGRYYMLGFVIPESEKCSQKKKIMNIAWNYNWIYHSLENSRCT